MANNSCLNCRKAGEKLFLKGDRCTSPNCAVTRRLSTNVKGQSRRNKKSEYGLQLAEKQQAKAEYGIREKQFRNYFIKAARAKEATGTALLQNLEMRLDNVIYRLGWVKSRSQARQLVNHGHFTVNDKKVDIPSYRVKIKDEISTLKAEILKLTANDKPIVPNWLESKKDFKAVVKSLPGREEIETAVDEQLIVEFYSR